MLSLLGLAGNSWACSCFDIATIEKAIGSSPLLVEAKVVAREEYEYDGHRGTHSVWVRVGRVLKGSLTREDLIVQHTMCYGSLYPDLMQVGHTYVLPLTETSNGRMEMAHCSHSGLELIDFKLYTFEQTVGAERRKQFYAKYPDFLEGLKSLGAPRNAAP
jgi:hypothetical protein